MARFGTVQVLDPLGPQQLAELLRSPKTSILNEYRKLFAAEDLDLSFTDEAFQAIADAAAARTGGAHSLRSVVEAVIVELSISLAREPPTERQIVVDPEMVSRSLG